MLRTITSLTFELIIRSVVHALSIQINKLYFFVHLCKTIDYGKTKVKLRTQQGMLSFILVLVIYMYSFLVSVCYIFVLIPLDTDTFTRRPIFMILHVVLTVLKGRSS